MYKGMRTTKEKILFRSHVTWLGDYFFGSFCSTCCHTDSLILIKTIDLSARLRALSANLISCYNLLKAFCFERSPIMTGRAARWRCHMWRSERLAGVTSITTRKKRAEKVVLPEVRIQERKNGEKKMLVLHIGLVWSKQHY